MRKMTKTAIEERPVVVFCGDSRPHPLFNEHGKEILPCGKKRCEKIDGASLISRRRNCADIGCDKEFQSACPCVIFDSLDCFLAAKNEDAWSAAGRQAADEFAQAAKKKKEKTPEQIARKRARNHADFERRKATGKQKERDERQRQRRTLEKLRKAEAKAREAESEGGLWRNHKFVRNKAGRNATSSEQ